jgi:hypothetical protein
MTRVKFYQNFFPKKRFRKMFSTFFLMNAASRSKFCQANSSGTVQVHNPFTSSGVYHGWCRTGHQGIFSLSHTLEPIPVTERK